MARATGDKMKHKKLRKNVEIINNKMLINKKIYAWFTFIFPEGRSRSRVRGFFPSICLSIMRLKLIAALRAKNMHNTISKKLFRSKGAWRFFMARKNPITAKGIAKTVCAIFTREEKSETRLKIFATTLIQCILFKNQHFSFMILLGFRRSGNYTSKAAP